MRGMISGKGLSTMETDLIFGGLGSVSFSHVESQHKAEKKTGQGGIRTILVFHSRRSLSRLFCADVYNRVTRTRTHLSNLQDILAAPRQ